jgi:GTPase SAR1 family protein
MPLYAQDVRRKFRRFRILVVGRANAGKTTLLQKVCNTTEKPEIFDGEGNKVNLTFHVTSGLPTDRS